MLPLPAPSRIEPRKGIEKLRELLRLRDPRDFVIIVAWLLAALASRGPFTVIIFLGEPGATKSSTAYAVRSIVDPNASPLRLKPREPRDVFIAANYGLVVAYNNLSNLPEWLSDTLCVVSEGSGESRRELYTDAEESSALRPRAVPAHRHRECGRPRRPRPAHALYPSGQRAQRRTPDRGGFQGEV